jgi:hypothetical protein
LEEDPVHEPAGAAEPGKSNAAPTSSRSSPNPVAVLRLATAVLAELHDEWIAFPRRYLSNESMDMLYTDTPTVLPAASDN